MDQHFQLDPQHNSLRKTIFQLVEFMFFPTLPKMNEQFDKCVHI